MAIPAGIADVEWGECLLPPAAPPAALKAEVRKQFGAVPGWVDRFTPSPWLARAFCRLHERSIAHAPLALCELIGLIVSQDNSCRYCYSNQRAFLKVLGYREDYIARLEHDFHAADLSVAESIALDFARKISHSNPRPNRADYAELIGAGYSPPAVAEIAYSAAAVVFANRVATLLALPAEPFQSMVDHPLFRLLRPLVALRMRRKPLRPAPLPEPNDGPCAAVVATLDGSPCATALRRVIDEAWASDLLPRRTKALMFAVIGKALGCPHSEREARTLLHAEGVPTRDVEDILTNLASPVLDRREAVLVPFARETVRYREPAGIQTRMREVAAGLGREEILDAVGFAALANAVCRLSVLVDLS